MSSSTSSAARTRPRPRRERPRRRKRPADAVRTAWAPSPSAMLPTSGNKHRRHESDHAHEANQQYDLSLQAPRALRRSLVTNSMPATLASSSRCHRVVGDPAWICRRNHVGFGLVDHFCGPSRRPGRPNAAARHVPGRRKLRRRIRRGCPPTSQSSSLNYRPRRSASVESLNSAPAPFPFARPTPQCQHLAHVVLPPSVDESIAHVRFLKC